MPYSLTVPILCVERGAGGFPPISGSGRPAELKDDCLPARLTDPMPCTSSGGCLHSCLMHRGLDFSEIFDMDCTAAQPSFLFRFRLGGGYPR